jgi:death-on-curing protein
MRYVSYSELIFINGRILQDTHIQSGKQKVRDIDLLLAAEQRPQASAFGADAYPTLHEKVGALLHSLARNHPFKDGNKRTAVVSALFMLEINGEQAQWRDDEALRVILDLAEGRKDVPTFAEWLQTTPSAQIHPEANLERDTAHIDTLLHTHRWLLDELAKQ